MEKLSAAWLYPIILVAGMLQAGAADEQCAEEGARESRWAPLGGLVGAFAVVAGLMFGGKGELVNKPSRLP